METIGFSELAFPGYAVDFAYCDVLSKQVRFPCSNCLSGWIDWEAPLQIRWGKDSEDVIADFTLLLRGAASLLVSHRVRQAVEPEFAGLEFLPVIEVKGQHRIRFRPDPGPLWWLKVPVLSPRVENRSWKAQGPPCPQCGSVVFRPPYWSDRHHSVHLEEDDVQGHPLFALDQFPGHIYMRADLKHFIMRYYFTGIASARDSGGLILVKEQPSTASRLEKKPRVRQSWRVVEVPSAKTSSPMPPYEEMPEDNAELAKLIVDFPRLADDTSDSCPVSMKEILDYLHLESPDGEEVEETALLFLRTAQVAEKAYWLWQFTESDGTECYVTVSMTSQGETCIGYEQNGYGLTPEQYLLGDYYNVF
jgi:hypothetical protein